MVSTKGNPRSEVNLAVDSETGADGVLALPARLARYSKARRFALEVGSFAQGAGHVKEAARLASCGNYLAFRDYFTVDQVRLHAASFCRMHLLCPLCGIRRASKMLKAYLDRWEVVHAAHPELIPYLVTKTVVNGPDLLERFLHLRSGLRQMSQARRDHLKGKGPFVEYSRSMGGFHSIESTNIGNGWHPHAHSIWLCSSAPSQEAIRREWKGWTGDSFIVDVRPISDPVSGFAEVLKYALKFSDLTPEQVFHAYRELRTRRMIDSHGLMRGVVVPESLLDEPLEELPYVELFYRYLAGGYTFTGSRHGFQDEGGQSVYFDPDSGEIAGGRYTPLEIA